MLRRSVRPAGSSASWWRKVTRSATPAARALTVAIVTDSSSMSIPSTAASGYARARAMLDQPPPLPTSSNLTAGRDSVSCNVLMPDSAGPSRLLVPRPVGVSLRLPGVGAELVPADTAAGAVGLEQPRQCRTHGPEHPADGREVGQARDVGHHLRGAGRDRVDACVGCAVVLNREQADHGLLLEPLARVARLRVGACGELRSSRWPLGGEAGVPTETVPEVDRHDLHRAEQRSEEPLGDLLCCLLGCVHGLTVLFRGLLRHEQRHMPMSGC